MPIISNNGSRVYEFAQCDETTVTARQDGRVQVVGKPTEWKHTWNIEANGLCDRCGSGQTRNLPCPWCLYTPEHKCGECDHFNQAGFCEQEFRTADASDISCCQLEIDGTLIIIEETANLRKKQFQRR